jgi:hypothetical protein
VALDLCGFAKAECSRIAIPGLSKPQQKRCGFLFPQKYLYEKFLSLPSHPYHLPGRSLRPGPTDYSMPAPQIA